MASATETLNRQGNEFDWDLAESQFSDFSNYDLPPEAEVYGRSLSTIHRLGAFMVEKSGVDAVQSPEADQVRIEFYTSVEEGFGTDPELGKGLEVRDFDERAVIDGKVMAKDLKTAVSSMTNAGLVCAQEKAKWDEDFLPQLIRSEWDHKNALIVDEMAAGKTNYNTRIVVTPYPEEAAARSGDEYWRNIGYVPHLERGFVQMYHGAEDGVATGSLSFDGSNKERIREVFARYNVEIPEDETTDNYLQYAITDTLSEDQAKALATEIADLAGDPSFEKTTNTVDVTNEHRSIMDKVFRESYVHACESLARNKQTVGARKLIFQLADKAQYFNEHYADALNRMKADKNQFDREDMAVIHDLLVYSTIEMMRALHLRKVEPAMHETSVYQCVRQFDNMDLQYLDAQTFQNMLSGFGADGAQNNRTYSACGLAISLGDEQETQNRQGVFGGADSKSEKNNEMKCVSCPECKTFHERVRFVQGKPVCDNKKCKLNG